MARSGASAPGKVMLAGEYAVLEGAPALVAAVGARVQASWSVSAHDGSPQHRADSPESSPLPPEVLVSRNLAEAYCGRVSEILRVDTHALRESGRKLGIGSSAANASAATAAVFAWHEKDIREPATKRAIFDIAFRGHQQIAPEGSGADVAASVFGGVVRFQRDNDAPDVTQLAWPQNIHASIVWTGKEARTSDFVRRVRALAIEKPRVHDEAIQRVAHCAQHLAAAFAKGVADDLIRATKEHADALEALGQKASAPIVEETLAKISHLASEHGGAAKGSGAGGGDVAIAFFSDAQRAKDFEQTIAETGFSIVRLELGVEGVRRESS